MPVGIFSDVFMMFCGGALGCLLGSRLSDGWKESLNHVLALAAIVMGLNLSVKGTNLSAVVLSLLLGAVAGEALGIETAINRGALAALNRVLGGKGDADHLLQASVALVIFCFNGTGWYGALNEGLTGDGSILLTKAIIDFASGCIFATSLGKIVPLLCIPQLTVFLILYGISGFVAPWITPVMISDFSAVGGVITLAAGLKLAKIMTDTKVLNLLPGLILSFFVSSFWTTFVAG